MEVASDLVLIGKVLLPTWQAHANRTQPFVIAVFMVSKLVPFWVASQNTEYCICTIRVIGSCWVGLGCWTSYRPISCSDGCFFYCANCSSHFAIAQSSQAKRIAFDPSLCLLATSSCVFSHATSSSLHLPLEVQTSFCFL